MPHHNLLLRQLRRLGIGVEARLPDEEQWLQLLERVSRAYQEADEERYLMKRSQEISSYEMNELHGRLHEALTIAGLGTWSFDPAHRRANWCDRCFAIFGTEPSVSAPSYRQLLRCLQGRDRSVLTRVSKAALQLGEPFETEFRLRLPSNELRWVRVMCQPFKNELGRVHRIQGTMVDVTRHKLAEMRQLLEHNVTRLLAEPRPVGAMLQMIIESICETAGWTCGALWTLDLQKQRYVRSFIWAGGARRAEEFFQTSTAEVALPVKTGLIGHVLRRSGPVWVADVIHDPSFFRAEAARRTGLHTALAFPVHAGGEVLGVMEFFRTQVHNPERTLLESADMIGRHIGQFFQRHYAEEALRESEAHFRALVEQASDGFYVHDVYGRFIDVNQQACTSLGYTREELLSMTIVDVDENLCAEELKQWHKQTERGRTCSLERRHRRKNGKTFPVEIRMGSITIKGKTHLLSLVRDVSEREQLQNHIQRLAYQDVLTNLPNRVMFSRRLQQAITRAERYQKRLALLFIDLDRFKNINDTLGHGAGDRLLQGIAGRITSCLRGGDLVARLGGDEFVVLLEEVADSLQVGHVAQKILNGVVKEYALDGQIIHVTASIGISLFPEDGGNEFTLMKHADVAMYRAKESGKNSYQFYSAYMDLHSARLLALESGLRRAIERDELILHYQPKFDARTGELTGLEALVRWNHPEFGMVSPGHFIPLAEETGLIVPLSQWVLIQACKQHIAWRQEGYPPLKIAVNLSARQFADLNLADETAKALADIGMEAEFLEFEITESMMMYNTQKTMQVLAQLREMGIRISIDDFGTGYSSLSHLKMFDIDLIKIDRSFIKDIPDDPADAAIAEAIIAMSKSLNIRVLAEGVETPAQLAFLRKNGCDEIQGNYFSAAVSPEEIGLLLKRPASITRLASR